jgi:hypothetical protein
MQEIIPTLFPGQRQCHETPTRAMMSCHATRTWRDVAFDGIVWCRRPFQARQCFSRQIKWTICIGFSMDFTLTVLLAFRNYLICSRLCAQFSVRHAETEKKWRLSNLKKVMLTREGFGWVTKTLCTQKEANAFSLWNNNLGCQGILEYVSLR